MASEVAISRVAREVAISRVAREVAISRVVREVASELGGEGKRAGKRPDFSCGWGGSINCHLPIYV